MRGLKNMKILMCIFHDNKAEELWEQYKKINLMFWVNNSLASFDICLLELYFTFSYCFSTFWWRKRSDNLKTIKYSLENSININIIHKRNKFAFYWTMYNHFGKGGTLCFVTVLSFFILGILGVSSKIKVQSIISDGNRIDVSLSLLIISILHLVYHILLKKILLMFHAQITST